MRHSNHMQIDSILAIAFPFVACVAMLQQAQAARDENHRQAQVAREKEIQAHKLAHGAGIQLEFPTKAQIDHAMCGMEEEYMVTAYGDGSVTTERRAAHDQVRVRP